MGALVGRHALMTVIFAVLAVLPIMANQYFVYIGNLVLIYILLAVGLNILVGYAGQLAFANAAMWGIGAYTCGLLKLRLGVPFFLALPAAGGRCHVGRHGHGISGLAAARALSGTGHDRLRRVHKMGVRCTGMS